MTTEDTTISIKKTTRERLSKLMRYGQSYDGMIRELMDRLDGGEGFSPSLIKRLTDYRSHPLEPIDATVKGVLDELDKVTEKR